MALFRRPALIDPRVVPTEDVEVNWGHPLTRGLQAFYVPGSSRGMVDFADNCPPMAPVSSGQTNIVSSTGGAGAYSPAASGAGLTTVGRQLPSSMNYAVGGTMWTYRYRISLTANTVEVPAFIAIWGSDGSIRRWMCYSDSTSTNFSLFENGNYIDAFGYVFSISSLETVACTYVPSGSSVGYLKGWPIKSVASQSTLGFSPSTDQLVLGVNGNQITLAGGFWGRPLSPNEIAWLDAEPFAMLRPRAPMRTWSIPSSGTTGTLGGYILITGASSGTPKITSITSASSLVAASLSGSPSTTGTISSLAPINAILAGTPKIQGSLVETISIAAEADGAPTNLGTITTSLSGALDIFGTTEVTGAIIGSVSQVGTLAGSSTIVGTLSGAVTISTSVEGVPTIDGSITDTIDISLTATGVVEVTGITGSIVAQVPINVAIVGSTAISGQAHASVTLTGSLSGTPYILGVLDGSIGTIFSSHGSPIVEGTLLGFSETFATLSGSPEIVGVIEGEVSIAGMFTNLIIVAIFPYQVLTEANVIKLSYQKNQVFGDRDNISGLSNSPYRSR